MLPSEAQCGVRTVGWHARLMISTSAATIANSADCRSKVCGSGRPGTTGRATSAATGKDDSHTHAPRSYQRARDCPCPPSPSQSAAPTPLCATCLATHPAWSATPSGTVSRASDGGKRAAVQDRPPHLLPSVLCMHLLEATAEHQVQQRALAAALAAKDGHTAVAFPSVGDAPRAQVRLQALTARQPANRK